MKYLVFFYYLIFVNVHCASAQHIEDTVLVKYFAKAGYENLSNISTFVHHCQISSLIDPNMFSVEKTETKHIMFLKNLSDDVLTRYEISETSINNDGRHIVFLKNKYDNTTSHVKNNSVYHFSTRTNYLDDNLIRGIGAGTFMICLGIYEAYKSQHLICQETGMFAGKECYKYSFTNTELSMQLYFDKATSLLTGIKIKKESLMTNDIVNFTKVFNDYKEIDGILVPMSVTVDKNKRFWYSINTKEVRFNVPLENEIFYNALEKSEYSLYHD